MEDTLQKVFAILLSVVVFFLLPLYMAFEKKDDIAYSMALRITSNFVDNVTNKGYITENMYNNFITDLALTGNTYEVTMQHKAKKYYPVIYATEKDTTTNKEKVKVKEYDYNLYKLQYAAYVHGSNGVIDDVNYTNSNDNTTLKLNYKLEELLYTEKQILGTVEGTVNAVGRTYKDEEGNTYYPMSKGDEFTVVIKNTNTTIASILFNTLTMGVNEETPKVYINYGGSIQNESYRKTALIGESTNLSDTHIANKDELAGISCSVVWNAKHSVGTVYGDIDQNTFVNNDDVGLLKSYDNKTSELDQKQIYNGMITKDSDISTDDITALKNYIDRTRPVLIKRSIVGKTTYTYYIAFDKAVKLKDGITKEKAVSVISKDVNGSNEKTVKIIDLLPNNTLGTVWRLTVEVENAEKIHEIRVNDNSFVAINDNSNANLESNTLKVHLYYK